MVPRNSEKPFFRLLYKSFLFYDRSREGRKVIRRARKGLEYVAASLRSLRENKAVHAEVAKLIRRARKGLEYGAAPLRSLREVILCALCEN